MGLGEGLVIWAMVRARARARPGVRFGPYDLSQDATAWVGLRVRNVADLPIGILVRFRGEGGTSYDFTIHVL